MKNVKLFVAMLAFGAFSLNSFAGNYKIDESAVEETIDQAEEININSFESISALGLAGTSTASIKAGNESKVVFLLAACVLGRFAVHRYYAGVDGLRYCGFYFCTGGIVAQIDFFHVLFGGSEVSDYGADEFIVW